jgi:hypothetical protein
MAETPLTKEQQAYAAEHHGLVYAFLNENKLPDDDFYDIVIFGYLRAVKRYHEEAGLAEKFSFSTIAWGAMRTSLSNHFTGKSRLKRKGDTFSLESAVYGDIEPILLHEILSAPDNSMIDFETEVLLLELASRVSKREMDVIRMKVNGYGVREIAKKHKMPMKGVNELLAGLRETVLAVCYELGG